MSYGMKEFKELLEKALKDYSDPMNCPFGMDPYAEGKLWREAKQGAITWVLEMIPTDDYEKWYEEAIIASNEAGFAGMDAASVIRYQEAEIERLKECEFMYKELSK